MADEVKDAPPASEEEVQEPEEETPEAEEPVKEDVKTKDYKELYENARAAVREEREKRKQLQSQQETAEKIRPPVDLVPEGQEFDARFLRAEADAYIAKMVSTDPTFQDRVDMVEEYVNQGYDIQTADEKAKAKLMDEIIKQSKDVPEKPKQPTKTETAATPEEEATKEVSYKDIKSGKDKSVEAQEMKKAMDTYGA